MQEQLALYTQEAMRRPDNRGVRRLTLYLGLTVLIAAASVVAVNNRGGAAAKFPRVLVPGSSAACTSPPSGFLFSRTVDGATMSVCISQEGNINQIHYPDTAPGHTQIAWDGYCIRDGNSISEYYDYSPNAPTQSFGFEPATLTQQSDNQLTMTRTTSDGRYQLTAFIKIRFQQRAIFVGMTVKNIDPANVTRQIALLREVAPAIDGSASDDQYTEFGGTSPGDGRTGHAFQSPTPGTQSLLFGPTQSDAIVRTVKVEDFAMPNLQHCASYPMEPVGAVTGGNRLFSARIGVFHSIAPQQSVNFGKFVYRMA